MASVTSLLYYFISNVLQQRSRRLSAPFSLHSRRLLQVLHAHQSSFICPHRVSNLLLTAWALVCHGAQSFLQRLLRVLVGQSAAPTQHGERVPEPTFFSDQAGDPRLSADAAPQGLQAQPPELRRLVPALLPGGAHLYRAGAGAGVQGAAEEPESCGKEAPLAAFNRAWRMLSKSHSCYWSFYPLLMVPIYISENQSENNKVVGQSIMYSHEMNRGR